MSIQYIFGAPASGKTTLCINEIANCDTISRRMFYIVPEQFVLESEKSILTKKDALVNINVLGFKHLAYYLISKLGTSGRTILDDTGNAMLIKKIVLELKNKLDYYKNSVEKSGFVDSLSATLSEIIQNDIDEVSIAQLITELKDGNLKEKLKDIQIILAKYKEYMDNSYIVSDGMLEILCQLIPLSVVKGADVWIDGFKSFTPQEIKVISVLLKECNSVTLTLPLTESKIEYGKISPFDEKYEIKKTVTAITAAAKENNISIKDVKLLDRISKKANEELNYIKDNFFKRKITPYAKNTDAIEIYKATNIYLEIDNACSIISDLVQSKGYRYKDIALVVGDSSYNVPLSVALKKFNIPNFLDGRRSIANHPFITFVTSAIDTIAYGYDNSYVFKLLKSGYGNIDFDDLYVLENYCLANGIDKWRWQKEWKYGFKDERNQNKPDKETILALREKLFDMLSPIANDFNSSAKAKAEDITKALIKFVEHNSAKEKLENEITKSNVDGDNVKAIVAQGAWEAFLSVTDKIIELLGNEKLTLKDYSKILKTGLSTTSVGVMPPTQDYLIVGDMDITRYPDVKAMLVIGANEGNIPVIHNENGIFNEDEKQIMEDKHIEFSVGVAQKHNKGKLNVYMNIIKAQEYLMFSYLCGSKDNQTYLPSIIIFRLKDMFPNICQKDVGNNININSTSKEAAFEYMIKHITNADCDNEVTELYGYFAKDEEYSKRLYNIKNALYSQLPQNYIAKDIMDIFWDRIYDKASVSMLEKYTACPFSFFMKRLLNVDDRDVFGLKATDIGIVSHKVMEQFSKHIQKNHIEWADADKTYTDNFVDTNISDYLANINTDIFENPRNSAIFKRLVETIKLSLWVNVEQIKASHFKPENFELSFGGEYGKNPPLEVEIDEDRVIKLKGIIDRVDSMVDENGKVYVKLVDYKSSSKNLDINKIFAGIQLQLVLYMNVLVKSKNANPAGMFYFKIAQPDFINDDNKAKSMSESDLILNRLALTGMYDNALSDYISSTKVNAIINRKNVETARDISKDSTGLDDVLMSNLLDKSIDIVKDISREMAKGNISISPYEYDKESPCRFCPYGIVCDIKNNCENIRKIEKDNNSLFKELKCNDEGNDS